MRATRNPSGNRRVLAYMPGDVDLVSEPAARGADPAADAVAH